LSVVVLPADRAAALGPNKPSAAVVDTSAATRLSDNGSQRDRISAGSVHERERRSSLRKPGGSLIRARHPGSGVARARAPARASSAARVHQLTVANKSPSTVGLWGRVATRTELERLGLVRFGGAGPRSPRGRNHR